MPLWPAPPSCLLYGSLRSGKHDYNVYTEREQNTRRIHVDEEVGFKSYNDSQ
jgi:hypothetical protein